MTPELLALSLRLQERRAFLWEAGMLTSSGHLLMSWWDGASGKHWCCRNSDGAMWCHYQADLTPPDLTHRPTVALLAVQAMNEGVSFGRWGKQWRASLPDESSIIADTLGEAAARALLAIKGVE